MKDLVFVTYLALPTFALYTWWKAPPQTREKKQDRWRLFYLRSETKKWMFGQ